MSLLRQIQDDAIDQSVPVTVLLRKCKVLAARLGHQPLEEWVEHELNGYPSGAPLPPYRAPIPLRLKGNFINAAWKAEGIDVPLSALPAQLVDPPPEKSLRDPIGDIEELARGAGEIVAYAVPAGLTAYVRLYQMMECYALWGEVPKLMFKNVLEQVRNRVLTFALEIEKENPEAGEAEPGSQPVAQETVSSIVNNTFYGGTNVVATSSPGAVQNVTVSFDPGDLAGLLDHLGGLGVEKEDLDELAEAIKEDGDARDEPSGFGRRVTAWLGRMSVKAATGAWRFGKAVTAEVLALAIAKYYGLT